MNENIKNEIIKDDKRYWSLQTIAEYLDVKYDTVQKQIKRNNSERLQKYIFRPMNTSSDGRFQDSIFLKVPESLILLCFSIKKLRQQPIVDKILEVFENISGEGDFKVIKNEDVENLKDTMDENKAAFENLKLKYEALKNENLRLTNQSLKYLLEVNKWSEGYLKELSKGGELENKYEGHKLELKGEKRTQNRLVAFIRKRL